MYKKQMVAQAALQEISPQQVLGIGTGSTVDCLIALLPTIQCPKQVVSSSDRTTEQLLQLGIEVCSLNDAGPLDLYIDGADQVLDTMVAIKGRGGAHTVEKILATHADQFVGMISEDKQVSVLTAPIPVEVIEQARSSVAREIVAMGGEPRYRKGKTDHGHVILDVYNLDLTDPERLETQLQLLYGVVEVGLFAKRRFDKLYIAGDSVEIVEKQ
jgi:ribose 5-phosphate isomerase A